MSFNQQNPLSMIQQFWSERWRFLVMIHDMVMIVLSWLGAYFLRDNVSALSDEWIQSSVQFLPILLPLQFLSGWWMGLYRGLWRFASIPDLMRIFKAVLLGATTLLVVLFFTTRLEGIPRSVIPVYALLLIVSLGAGRFIQRYWKEYVQLNSLAKRVLIIGAGKAGESLARDLLKNRLQEYRPVAFVDDDRSQQGRDLQGISIVGQIENIPEIVARFKIECIFIAIPSAKTVQMRRIIEICTATGLEVKTLPSLRDAVSLEMGHRFLRKITLEDLLGREPITVDWQRISEKMIHKVILVTGGAGSIGSELCRQIARCEPVLLIVVDRHEYGLFSLEQDLNAHYPALKWRHYLADINDSTAMEHIFDRHHPHIVFHAAAYKHVPLLQDQLRSAVYNNVLGTERMAYWSMYYGVSTFVLVSTDKAVNPTNTMGMTKRAAEMIMQMYTQEAKTQFITVRFGNVLGSTGSVVPLFEEQLKKGGPLTVTHPEIERYFMMIPEATQLIVQTLVLGTGGDVFVLDMGQSVKIRFLAEQMIRLSGARIQEVGITYTGLRPGEKMTEELFHAQEPYERTSHAKIYRSQARAIDYSAMRRSIVQLRQACDVYDEERIGAYLSALVPEAASCLDLSGQERPPKEAFLPTEAVYLEEISLTQ